MSATVRLLVLSIACVAVLAGCARTAGPEASPSPTVDASAVNDAMAAVADARRVAAEQIDAELRAAVRVEPMAAGLRSPSSVDATLQDVPGVVVLFERADPTGGAAVLDRLDAALAAAEPALQDAAGQVGPGSWEERFLAAQRDVVASLTAWSSASRGVHVVVQEHWDLWSGVVEAAAALDENRWRYRSVEESAGTWEIEIDDQMESLTAAAATVADAAEARDEAATAVTAADDHATEVFENRPTQAPAQSSDP